MGLFFLRNRIKQIQKEIKTMSVALDNLTTAVTAAVNQLAALTAKVTALEAQVAAGDNSAAEQALADQLNAAVAANPT